MFSPELREKVEGMGKQPGLHGIDAFHINSGSDTNKLINSTGVILGSRQDLMKFVLGWEIFKGRNALAHPFFLPSLAA